MKYVANPIVVDAVRITAIREALPSGHVGLDLDSDAIDGEAFTIATPEMLSRFKPAIGDYVVRQADGYIYLNPAEIFERKYTARP
jgi:hypothetical protein